MFTQNKDERRRVKKALDDAGIPSGKVSNFTILCLILIDIICL